MKKLITIVIVFGLFISACKKNQKEIIDSIRKEVAATNDELKEYTMRQVDDIVSPENGAITGYYRDDEVRKILTQHFGEKSRNFISYYFDDGMLIFVESRDYIYNLPTTYTEEVAKSMGDSMWYDDSKTMLDINKYYFSENKLIKWTGADTSDVPVNIAEFTEKEPVLLAGALLAIKQLKAYE